MPHMDKKVEEAPAGPRQPASVRNLNAASVANAVAALAIHVNAAGQSAGHISGDQMAPLTDHQRREIAMRRANARWKSRVTRS